MHEEDFMGVDHRLYRLRYQRRFRPSLSRSPTSSVHSFNPTYASCSWYNQSQVMSPMFHRDPLDTTDEEHEPIFGPLNYNLHSKDFNEELDFDMKSVFESTSTDRSPLISSPSCTSSMSSSTALFARPGSSLSSLCSSVDLSVKNQQSAHQAFPTAAFTAHIYLQVNDIQRIKQRLVHILENTRFVHDDQDVEHTKPKENLEENISLTYGAVFLALRTASLWTSRYLWNSSFNRLILRQSNVSRSMLYPPRFPTRSLVFSLFHYAALDLSDFIMNQSSRLLFDTPAFLFRCLYRYHRYRLFFPSVPFHLNSISLYLPLSLAVDALLQHETVQQWIHEQGHMILRNAYIYFRLSLGLEDVTLQDEDLFSYCWSHDYGPAAVLGCIENMLVGWSTSRILGFSMGLVDLVALSLRQCFLSGWVHFICMQPVYLMCRFYFEPAEKQQATIADW